MSKTNPYESPRAKSGVDGDFRRWPFDIGKFVGWYLLGLGMLSVGSMVVGALFYDELYINFAVIIYFIAGVHLIKHNPTARKLVIGLSGLASLAILGFALAYLLGGKSWFPNAYVSLGDKVFEDPSRRLVMGVSAVFILICGLPCALLLTRQARAEFQRTPQEPNWPRPVPMPHEEDVPGNADS